MNSGAEAGRQAHAGPEENGTRTKQVLLVNGWSDDNKGDAAIVQGFHSLLAAAADRVGLQLRLGIVSNFSRDSEDFDYHYRHSRRSFEAGIFGAIIPTNLRDAPGGAMGKGIRRAGQFLTSLLTLAFPTRSRPPWLSSAQAETLAQFQRASMVVSKGGHIYASTGSPLSLLGLYSNLYPLLLAQRLRVPTGVYAQSIGPVRGGLQRMLVGGVLERCDFVYVREERSREYVRQLLPNVGPDKLQLVWDTAFGVTEEALQPETARKLPPEFVAVTVRQWRFPYSPDGVRGRLYEQYLNSMADVVRRLVAEVGTQVVVVPQVIGPTALENDLVAGQQLAERLVGLDGVTYLTEDLTAGQLRQLYSRATMLIGTRFHSVILALSALTPAVAISYHGFKTKGIMQMLDLASYALDIGSLSPDELWERVRAVFDVRDEYRAHLRARMDDVIAEAASEADRAVAVMAA